MAWEPTDEEAAFIGHVMVIDAGLAGIVRDQIAKGIPLRNVKATLEDALRIAALIRGDQS